jgi:hypothetical protein
LTNGLVNLRSLTTVGFTRSSLSATGTTPTLELLPQRHQQHSNEMDNIDLWSIMYHLAVFFSHVATTPFRHSAVQPFFIKVRRKYAPIWSMCLCLNTNPLTFCIWNWRHFLFLFTPFSLLCHIRWDQSFGLFGFRPRHHHYHLRQQKHYHTSNQLCPFCSYPW